MHIIDISWPITPQMTAYKNESSVQYTAIRTLEKDNVRKTGITLDSHTGTHVDAPAHFLSNGATSEQIKLDRIIGNCVVIDMTHIQDTITAEDIEEYDLAGCDIILFKTTNSESHPAEKFDAEFICLDASAAMLLAELGIQAVGIDYLGIERNNPNHDVHRILWDANIAIIEGLRLDHVEEDAYFFVCLPLSVVGLDGAPARAILVADLEEEEE
jgi:arylformamidase